MAGRHDASDDRERQLRWLAERGMSRREVLRAAGVIGLAAGVPGLLAACGDSDDDGTTSAAAPDTTAGGASSAPATSAAAEPLPASSAEGSTAPATTEAAPATSAASVPADVKTGGRLRVGHVGGGKGESFNPGRGSSFIDASRAYNVYDPLTRVNPDFSQAPGLALEWTPNADSTVWEVKLRPDVVFHDGKPFTADDVIFTLRAMGDEAHVGHAAVTNIKLDALKKVDALTLEIPLSGPDARLSDSFVQQSTVIIQDGATDFAKPVGTGPFKFQEFEVGVRSLCVKNPDYWEPGKPYVDEWEDISIDDNAARLNALLAGEIDLMSQLDFVQARAKKDTGEIQVLDAPSPAFQVILMRVDRPPFDDPLVRQAFRLIADRQALIDGALGGFGTPANDLFGQGLPYHAADLPVREQDLEQAKALLAQAGKEGLEVTLQTSDIVPGFTAAATLFAEQAKGAGVTVNVKKEPANSYFDTSLLYTKIDFGQSYWTTGSLAAWYSQALDSKAVWNETHWKDPEFDALIRQATGATNVDEATDLWHQVQQIQYDQGGYIGWANQNIVDAAAPYLQGMVPSAFFNLGGWNYRDVWLDQ